MSTASSDLLAKSPVRMTDTNILGILGMPVIFTVADFKFWEFCLVNISVRNGKSKKPRAGYASNKRVEHFGAIGVLLPSFLAISRGGKP